MAGQRARTGGSSRDRGSGHAPIDTLEVSRQGHTQDLAAKTTSGGEVKVSPRRVEMNPKEQSLRGDRAPQELNTPAVAADRYLDQSPGGEVTGSGVVVATRRQEMVVNDRRARDVDETVRLGGGNKPLRG
jgi:hypothetical protein